MSTILVDMDGVIADWGRSWDRELDNLGSPADNIPRHRQQRSFNLMAGLNEGEQLLVSHVMSRMDYATLPVIPGAIYALRSMEDSEHDVLICTSPWIPNPTCIRGKQVWVDTHLGADWVDRMVVTKDKTVVMGDILIDDKPNITGRMFPTWGQVVFDQPYNQGETHLPRLMSWADWKNEDY